MEHSSGKRVLGVYLLVLALGAAVSILIYLNGNAVLSASMPLLEKNLPLLDEISRLKAAIIEQEPILYRYYASGDRNAFLRQQRENQQSIEAALREVIRTFQHTGYELQNKYVQINSLAVQLDDMLKAGQMEPGEVRPLLAQVGTRARHMNQDLDVLFDLAKREVYEDGHNTESRIHAMINIVFVFSAIVFLIAVFVGYYVNAYISDTAERRKLALFTEKNPNPVLRLSGNGAVLYANPGAAVMLQRIDIENQDAARLLPADLPDRLARMRQGEVSYERWEYAVDDVTLGCGIQFLPEFEMFHVYLSDITERKRAEQKLFYQAYHDTLTRLPNRRMFQESLEQATGNTSSGRMFAVLLLNVDRFKLVVSGLGHGAGDRLLQAVAERLQRSLEECKSDCLGGTLFRFEGDMFAMLISQMNSPEAPEMLAHRIAAYMEEPFYLAGRELFVTLSIGMSVCPLHGTDPVTLTRNADAAMQLAKRRGGNVYQAYNQEMNAKALDRLALANRLRRALELKELSLHYQAQADIASGGVIGAEALLRWQHPERGFVSPADFIPLAEETGLIVPIGEWVLYSACAQQKAWQGQGLAAATVAVNISANQFQQTNFTRMVGRVLRETGLSPDSLELEITEGVATQNAEQTIGTLRESKEMGVRLSIDDFGTGYSSLSYLKRFPVDKLKVDQSFVRNLTKDANDAAIAKAVIGLGHSLNLSVIAEGVETWEHLAQLRGYGCDEMQGYLFSRPVPPEAFAALMKEGRRLTQGPGSATASQWQADVA